MRKFGSRARALLLCAAVVIGLVVTTQVPANASGTNCSFQNNVCVSVDNRGGNGLWIDHMELDTTNKPWSCYTPGGYFYGYFEFWAPGLHEDTSQTRFACGDPTHSGWFRFGGGGASASGDGQACGRLWQTHEDGSLTNVAERCLSIWG